MIDNSKYTTYKEIIARVSSLVRHKNINPADIMAWSIECETEWIQSFASLVPYYKAKITVKDKMARVPPYCARLLDVYSNPDDEKSHVNYYNNGAYIILGSDYVQPHVYINFMGLPLDEEGIPLIKKGHEEACVWHCLVNAHLEDFINGRISPTAYGEMKGERNLQVQAAMQSYSDMDRQELMEIAAIHMNMLPYIRFNTLANYGIS